MHTPRCFVEQTLTVGKQLELPGPSAHHLIHVLRMRQGQTLTLFNGLGGEYNCEITLSRRSQVSVRINTFIDVERESPLFTSLGLAVLKRQAMDAALVRATEMGVTEIWPVITENCSVSRHQIKPDHWLQVIRSSCEQCGRNTPPRVHQPTELASWLNERGHELCLLANPEATLRMTETPANAARVAMLIGPEGGMTDGETRAAESSGFVSINLGRRVMRAETVPTALLTLVQQRWGDL
jgi:16S rRNA (uracil1498-N3)-methyltransferase